jgi:DNA-binding SARP family transcriptional activator
VHFGLLGSLVVRDDDGVELAVGGPLPRALLAILLLAESRTVPVETLLDQLWDGEPPGAAQATLQSTISRLRRVLEPSRAAGTPWQLLRSEAGGYRLAVAAEHVDAHRGLRVEAQLAAGLPAAAAEHDLTAAGHLVPADELWALPFLELARARITTARQLAPEEIRCRLAAALEAGRRAGIPAVERLADGITAAAPTASTA